MLELNKIYCENCDQTMKRMPDEFVDLTVTSPPYDSLRNYNGYSFDFPTIAKELFRVTKNGGVVVWVIDDEIKNGNRSLSSFRQGIFFQDVGFNFYDLIIYVKKSGGPPHLNRYRDAHEFMFVMSKGNIQTINLICDKNNTWVGKTGNYSKRNKNGILTKRDGCTISEIGIRYNLWEYLTGHGFEDDEDLIKIHPAKFPEALARDHIFSWSNEGDLIYDPFMGSGTVAKMAHLMKRNWIGSEISQQYVDLANKRLEKYLNQTSLFEMPPKSNGKSMELNQATLEI